VFGLEIENGRMSRRLAADLLAMAKTTPDNQDEPTSDDTSSDEESSNTAAKTKPIRLSPEQYALYLEKGGIEWLVAQLVA
jgi:hypothetical protein